jgi:hypothetical protein
MFVSGVRFKIMQQGEPKILVLDASDETVEVILDYAQARGASVGISRGGQLRDYLDGSIFGSCRPRLLLFSGYRGCDGTL